MNKQPLTIYKITAAGGKRLSKGYSLDGFGALQKKPGGALVNGRVELVQVGNLKEFADVLATLTPSQALTYGGPGAAAEVVTKDAWARRERPDGVVPRARSHFIWPDGAGVLLVDYDPPTDADALDRDALIGAIRAAAPGLADAAMVWWPSSSSHIVNRDTGDDLTGLRGQRLYIAVADASDIPRAGQALYDRLWIAGHGRFDVSAAGTLLERTLIDGAVWQPERLDFASGAATVPPLEQRRGDPVLIDGTVEVVDTRAALPNLDHVEDDTLRAAKAEARTAAKPAAEAARQAWIADRVQALMPDGGDEHAEAEARRSAERVLDQGILGGDHTVHVIAASGDKQAVSVAEILDRPADYHALKTLDPVEPDYDGGRPVGKLYLLGSRPRLFSFARGGRTYTLARAAAWVEIVRGEPDTTAEAALDVLRRQPDWFDHGDQLVRVENGRLRPLTRNLTWLRISGVVRFFRWKEKDDDWVRDPQDPPSKVCDAVLEAGSGRNLKPLEAVISAPTLRRDGTVLDTPGYDTASRLLYEPAADVPAIPESPTEIDARRALNTLWWPFNTFPFVDPTARGVYLAGLLTACVRPALPTAPGFGLDAPTQGSGKTLLAKCLGALCAGEEPAVRPHVASDDDEVRKRLTTILRDGDPCVVWDNVVGSFDSPALAGALTSSTFKDRVLGASIEAHVPNRTLFTVTGNNISLVGDLARRIPVARLNPECAAPWTREFALNPLAYTLENRQQLVAAALTLIRAWLTIGDVRAQGRTASFETWDDLVRQTVCWVGRRIARQDDGGFGDPAATLSANAKADPETEATDTLLTALHDIFGESVFTAKDVMQAISRADSGFCAAADQELAQAVRDIVGRRDVTSKSVGRVIQFRRDRIVGGLRLNEYPPVKKTRRWCVVKAAEAAA
jgi:hypothetical protein